MKNRGSHSKGGKEQGDRREKEQEGPDAGCSRNPAKSLSTCSLEDRDIRKDNAEEKERVSFLLGRPSARLTVW
jgi:hypothetical protein